MTARRSILPVFFIILFSVLACKHRHHPAEETGAYDLTQIKDSGELVVLTLYSSTTYFIYRGQEMGFQYELSEQFAKSLGVKLRVEVARNVSELIQRMERQPHLLWRGSDYTSGNRTTEQWQNKTDNRRHRTHRQRSICKAR